MPDEAHEHHGEQESADERGLRSYEVDEDAVRINNPAPNEPDKIVRRLADGSVKSYDAKKR